MKVMALVIVLFFIACQFVQAQSKNEARDDLVLRAIDDELARTMTRLQLKGHSRPYFCQFNLYENDDFSVEATLGAVTSLTREKQRTFDPVVRVGDYKFDNTNFEKEESFASASQEGYEQLGLISETPCEDNYGAIRKTFWINTDYNYKKAVEALEAKKAYILERSREEELDDFIRVKPVVYVKPVENMVIDEKLWTDKVVSLSRIFRKYPEIRNSWVRFDERIINTWMKNSEGTVIRTTQKAVRILSYANIQAKDGSVLTDGRVFLAHDREHLPELKKIETELDNLARSLIERSNAEKLDYYEGPVLFEGQAAGQVFARVMAPYLVNHRKKLGASYYDDSYNKLARRLGRRVMPLFLSVVDDPFARFYKGKSLFGGFTIDDEGVVPEKLSLIEDGYLKTLCSGRTPSKYISKSNGHGSYQSGYETAKYSVLFVKSKETDSKSELLKKLKELGRKSRLEYVIVVRRLANNVRDGSFFETVDSQSSNFGPLDGQLTSPIDFYKISLKTGKRTLLRGGKFGPVTVRLLKDIVAVGDDSDAYPVEDVSNNYFHLITPSILISEVEIEKEDDVRKPPLIPNPLYELVSERDR